MPLFAQDTVPESEQVTDKQESLVWLAVTDIQAGAYQPRHDFTDSALAELQQSIAQYGVLQPLIVRALPSKEVTSKRYEIIAGERRFRAAVQAGLHEVPCWIRHFAHHDAATVALVENLQRQDLNVVEVARAYQRLIQEFSYTHQQIAQMVGCSRSAVSNTLRLLALTPKVLSALQQGRLEMAHARALLTLPPEQQQQMLEAIEREGLSVRAVEKRVRQSALVGKQRRHMKTVQKDVDIVAVEQRLSAQLGCDVQIKHRQMGGKILLHYHDLETLDVLLQQLGYQTEEW